MSPFHIIIGGAILMLTFCQQHIFASFLVTDYPNPFNNASLWKCGISSVGPLCDPDSLLNDTARQEALELLKQFRDQTDINNNGDGSCKSQGVIVGLAFTKQPIVPRNSNNNVTDDLMKNIWNLDSRCNKALMLTLSIQPNPVVRFTRYVTTPVFDDELYHLIWTEMHWLRERNYIMWVRLVLDGIRALVLDRHSTIASSSQQLMLAAHAKSCASHGFVIFCAFIAVLCSVVGTLCAPWLWHQCCQHLGPIVGKQSPFPMVRFNNNEHDVTPPYTINNGHQ